MHPQKANGAGRRSKPEEKRNPAARRKPGADPSEPSLTRPAFGRMLYIHERLRRGEYPSSRSLARELEVSAKTVLRDLDFMRDRVRLPIDYDPSRHGYFYTREVTEFPCFQITEGELIALCLAQLALGSYHGTPFEAPLRSAFRKLSDLLPDEVSLKLDELDGAISFHGADPLAPSDLQLFETVSGALLAREEIEFLYHKLDALTPEGELRKARPLHLTCQEGAWYLFAHDLERNDVRTFAVVRMEAVRRTGRRFELQEPFRPESRLANSIGIHSGGEVSDVRMRFRGVAARLVRERPCHPTQKTREVGAGEVELTMRVALNPELERWILGWGADALVVEPDSLRTRLGQAAERIAAQARNGDWS